MRTIFEQFAAYNAGCIEEAVMPLEDQGLVLIRGENLDEGDSNGSGKTTLFELFAHTLFGKTSKGPRKNSLLNKANPQDFHTQALFRREPGSRYQVDQYRKHSKKGTSIDICVDGAELSSARTKYDDAQRQVGEFVGLLWSQFQGQLYLSQKYTHTMLEGKPSEKQAYMSRYFGLESLDMLISEVTTRISASPLPDESQLKEMLAHVEVELKALGEADGTRKSLEQLKVKQADLQEQILTLRIALDQQVVAKSVREDRNRWNKFLSKYSLELEADSIKQTLTQQRKRESKLSNYLKALATKASITSQLSTFDLGLSQSYDEVSEELETLTDKMHELERVLPRVKEREELLARLEPLEEVDSDISVLSSKLESRKSKYRKIKKKLAVLENEILNLEKISGVCPTCFRSLPEEERRSMLEGRQVTLDDLSAKSHRLKTSAEELRGCLERLTLKHKLEERLQGLPDADLSAIHNQLSSVTSRRKKLSRLASQLVEVNSLQQKLADLDLPPGSKKEIDSKLSATQKRIERLEDAYDFAVAYGDMVFNPKEYQRLTESLTACEEALEAVNDDIFAAQDTLTKIAAYSTQKRDLEKSLNASSAKKNRQQALHYVNFTLKELKKQGLRESSELLTQVLPLYLKHFYPQGSVQLRVTDKADGFDLIFEKGGQSISLPEISGGQAKRVGIAIIFAFAKMGRRTTNLLIADEPFIHLDRRGREACYELLRDLDIGTLLVTAHDQDLQATRKYDRIWTVRMQDHRSRLYLDG